MQAWVFNQDYWDNRKVEAFLSGVPIVINNQLFINVLFYKSPKLCFKLKGDLLILDLYAETMPHYMTYNSFYGHLFVWNMLHNFGGANGIFGPFDRINMVN